MKGSTGTGFAAPIIIGEPEIRRRRGRAMLIIGSMCFFGFNVSLPASLAVGSPRRSATNPWEISWIIAEKSNTARNKREEKRSILFTDLEYDIIFGNS